MRDALTIRSGVDNMCTMTITAKVHNRTITLPAEVEVPDGAEVQVTLPDASPAKPQVISFFDSIRDLVGSIKDGPEDLAAEHDHYAHGAPKRAGK
jgi:hypothetical protein